MTGIALLGLYVFLLACVTGYQLINKVPPILHTPLTSGSNAISGITILGAMYAAGSIDSFSSTTAILAGIAVAAAMVNVVGGYMVTNRMLKMFGGKKGA
jgi:NAD(P) transhydrogenase subunit alpha